MSVVITGAGGQVGRALQDVFPKAAALSRGQLDITHEAAVFGRDWSGVTLIINAAAYTAVDLAETEAGHLAAWSANALGVAHLAKLAGDRGITLVHFSSEYVFDGKSSTPYTEMAEPSPLGSYGRSKVEGDRVAATAWQHYIIRTSWVVGDGRNFVRTMAERAQLGLASVVVNDQIGRLTFTSDLAAGVAYLLEIGAPYGTYNLTSLGDPASWYEVARLVYQTCGADPNLVSPISTEQYFARQVTAAPRPLNSVLDVSKTRAAGFSPGVWRERLADYL